MAIIKRGILGGVQNKIGNVVGSSWKGIATLRSLPLSVANPKTAAQTAVRTQFSITSKIASAFLVTIIKPLWDRFAQQQSGYNAWIQANIENFGADGSVAYDTIEMSRGSLTPSDITACVADTSDHTISIEWIETPGGDSSPTDLLYISVIQQQTDEPLICQGFATSVQRGAGSYEFTYNVPATAIVLMVYISFKKTDGTKVSNSTYAEATIQA
jgi:hypothetical protein